MKGKIGFSIIIPNLNGAKLLTESLPFLLKSIQNCPQANFEVILVDNGSTDESFNVLNHFFLESRIIILDKNYGFAHAVNQGIATAKFPYVCLLNNDVNLKSDWFNQIVSTIKLFSKSACFCGTVLNKDGTTMESQGISFEHSGKCIQLKTESTTTTPIQVWGSTAAAVIYQKNVLQKIGGFDSSFFAYLEDVDVAIRLSLSGYQTILTPLAISWHLGGGTSQRFRTLRQYYSFRNWFFIIIKLYPLNWVKQNILALIEQRCRNLFYLIINTPILLIPFLPIKAVVEIIYNLPQLLSSRHQFQKLLKSVHKL